MRPVGSRICVVSCLMIVIGWAAQGGGWARGATIFNDGQPHTINSSIGDVIASGGSQISVLTGAAIVASAGTPGLTLTTGAALAMTDGTITGGAAFVGKAGVLARDGDVTIGQGIVHGGASIPGGDGGGTAVNFWTDGHNNLAISSGTFMGGAGGFGARGGEALFIGLFGSGSVATISGGQFLGGLNPFATVAISARGVTNTVLIAGGSFGRATEARTFYLSLAESASVTFAGSGVDYSDATHTLTGTLADGSPIAARIDPVLGTHVAVLTGTAITFRGSPIALALPEPTSWIMLGIGVAAVGIAGRRNRYTE